MNKDINLIVMLTDNDHTVLNACDIFEKAKNSNALYWGFKECPLPVAQMKDLFARMKNCGKKTVLEVVAYEENECLKGAEIAVECGCDILMGTVFSHRINQLCKSADILYMPFVGNVSERPSVLEGEIDSIIQEAKEYISAGAYGIDLLGYRYSGNSFELIKRFVSEVQAPVCVAGSVNSYERLNEIKTVAPKFFTVGSAFFEKKFGEDFLQQINEVCDYIC